MPSEDRYAEHVQLNPDLVRASDSDLRELAGYGDAAAQKERDRRKQLAEPLQDGGERGHIDGIEDSKAKCVAESDEIMVDDLWRRVHGIRHDQGGRHGFDLGDRWAWFEAEQPVWIRVRHPHQDVEGREHELKCWPTWFGDVESGAKSFEIRRNDRSFCAGDRLRLREWLPDNGPERGGYTGCECLKLITYVADLSSFGFEGYVGMSLAPSPDDRPDTPELAAFDPTWEDARPICHVCKKEIPRGEVTVLPAGRHVEDDDEFVGVLVHQSCPASPDGRGGER